jgi:transcriptional regulator with XRE-family HTH domain
MKKQNWTELVNELKVIIDKRGITQKELAGMTGLKQQNISLMLNLKRPPTIKTFLKIVNAVEAILILKRK